MPVCHPRDTVYLDGRPNSSTYNIRFEGGYGPGQFYPAPFAVVGTYCVETVFENIALPSQITDKGEYTRIINYGEHVLNALSIKENATQRGFSSATPVSKPVVTGSRGGNTALGSLLSALASLGLLTDNTTP